MYYHQPREIHDSLLEMELTKSFQSSVPRIDSNKIISLTTVKDLTNGQHTKTRQHHNST